MKMNKRIAGILLAILIVVMLLPVQALAAGNIDLQQVVALTISYQNGDTTLAGAEFDIYLVATVDEHGELTTAEDFAQYNVNIRGENSDAWTTLASTLEGYALRDEITPSGSGKTDELGILSFPIGQNALAHGLYLVIGHRHTQSGYSYDAKPFMVLLPTLDEKANDWLYDVTVEPKYDSQPEPVDDTVTRKVLKVWKDEGYEKNRPKEVIVQLLRDGEVFDTVSLNAENDWRYTWEKLDAAYPWTVAEKTQGLYTVEATQEGITFVVTNTYGEGDRPTEPGKPSIPGLPQTGQLWWAVPVLIAAGLLLVVIGLLLRRGGGHGKK